MNQATPAMTDANGIGPVPATIMGAGRVRVDEAADALSVATPGSLSFGLAALAAPSDVGPETITVTNFDSAIHNYTVTSDVRFSEFEGEVATAQVSLNGVLFEDSVSFPVPPGLSVDVQVQLSVDPTVITPIEQEYGMYYFFPDLDGAISIEQDGDPGDSLRVPWHLVPLAASDNSAEATGDPIAIQIAAPESAGVDHADLFILDATDDTTTGGEEDITHAGVRSFVGPTIGDGAVGLPAGTDPLAGIGWLDFLTNGNVPEEPISFAIRAATIHNTTEAYEANVYIDVGNDGNYADDAIGADFVLSKVGDGTTCLLDLSAPDDCAATYYPDYTVFNSNLTGLVVDAGDLGLAAGNSQIGYSYELCTDSFSGDVPQPICEEVGRTGSGGFNFSLDVVAPPLELSTWVCEGFFGGPSCTEPITVSQGSGQQALVLFPNNAPDENVQVLDLE
jgi:hypothetical protein